MCILVPLRNVSHSNKNSARYSHEYRNVFTQSTRYPCRIVIKVECSRNIFEKYSDNKFHENPSTGSRVVSVTFRNFANAPKIQTTWAFGPGHRKSPASVSHTVPSLQTFPVTGTFSAPAGACGWNWYRYQRGHCRKGTTIGWYDAVSTALWFRSSLYVIWSFRRRQCNIITRRFGIHVAHIHSERTRRKNQHGLRNVF
jgi:hypothetical protein